MKPLIERCKWKHDSGDHEETYDWYLWIDGKPTNHCISQASGVYYIYINNKERGMRDTLKEAKLQLIGMLRG